MTNNTFNYRFSTLDKLLVELERLIPKKEKLEKNGLKIEIKVLKSKYKYWNLKLRIYNEQSNNTKSRILTEESIIHEKG